MRFTVKDHRGMSLPFAQSLIDAGHTPVSPDESFDLLLIDYDIDYPIYEQFYKRADEENARILMYPHGAGVLTIWDGQREANPRIDAALVYAPGYAEIMELYYPHPIHVVGWPYGIRPIRPREPKRVLLAARHPSGLGYLHPEIKRSNAEALEFLLSEGWDVTVRHVGTLEQNGLEILPGVRYLKAHDLNGLDTDVVVAAGTFAAISVANGLPTVIWEPQEPWRYDDEVEPRTKPEHWEEYRNLLESPVPLEPGAVERVAENPRLLDGWRERYVGVPFDAIRFVELAESVVGKVAA